MLIIKDGSGPPKAPAWGATSVNREPEARAAGRAVRADLIFAYRNPRPRQEQDGTKKGMPSTPTMGK